MSDECGVTFGGDYDVENELYVETWRRARRAHKCGECRNEIPVGARYLRVVGKGDGRMWTAVVCEPCNTILLVFVDGPWTFGGRIWEDLRDVWSEGVPLQPCLNRLTDVSSKTKLRDMWLSFKGVSA